MPRKPNYRFERNERARAKALKKAERLQARQARKEGSPEGEAPEGSAQGAAPEGEAQAADDIADGPNSDASIEEAPGAEAPGEEPPHR
jgi:hypothetical protein